MKVVLRLDIDREWPPVEYRLNNDDEITVTRGVITSTSDADVRSKTVRDALRDGLFDTAQGTVMAGGYYNQNPDIRVGLNRRTGHVVGRHQHVEYWDGEEIVRTTAQGDLLARIVPDNPILRVRR